MESPEELSRVEMSRVESTEEMIRHCSSFGVGERVLFRGQREPWRLLPKIARDLKPRVKNTHVPDLEKELLDESRWRALPHTQGALEDWEWLALAQHYGLPTRLLDWTTNPLAALWFAVREPPHFDRPGLVWMFLPKEEHRLNGKAQAKSPFDVELTQVFRPTHMTQRITVQSGWFTVHQWISKDNRFIPLESDTRYTDHLLRIEVPPTSFALIREELGRMDIHSASMFPDLSGLAAHVEWLHILDKNE